MALQTWCLTWDNTGFLDTAIKLSEEIIRVQTFLPARLVHWRTFSLLERAIFTSPVPSVFWYFVARLLAVLSLSRLLAHLLSRLLARCSTSCAPTVFAPLVSSCISTRRYVVLYLSPFAPASVHYLLEYTSFPYYVPSTVDPYNIFHFITFLLYSSSARDQSIVN